MQPKRILVIRTDRIGDVVLTTPALKALRQAFPQAYLSLMVTPTTVDLVKGNPYIDEILIDDRQGIYKGFFGFLQLARLMRSKHFDTAVIYHTKQRYNLACFLAGIPLRLGYKNNKGGCFLTMPVKDTRPQGIKHEAVYCLDLIKSIGVNASDLSLFLPQQHEADQWARDWYQTNVPEGFSLIAIHPGSSDFTRCWDTANYAALINQIANRFLTKIVFVGAENNRVLVNQIIPHVKNSVLDLTGKTTVAQTVALTRRMTILISGDSGPVHIAAAVGCLNLCLFLRNAPGINVERWHPLGSHSTTLTIHPQSANQTISVEEVMVAIDEMMQKENQTTFVW